MKNSFKIMLVLSFIITVYSCKKDKQDANPIPPTDNSTAKSLLLKNASSMQTYTIDGVSGGSFTTPQGTFVSIPANAFIYSNGNPVTGSVTIKFKDIYKKSDMLLNDMSTNLAWGGLLKSAGMFYIKALQGNQAVDISSGRKITVTQPLNGLALDTLMEPFRFQNFGNDSTKGWVKPQVDSNGIPIDSLYWSSTAYMFSLYRFNSPIDSGSWCNSDDEKFFSAYSTTSLVLHSLNSYIEYNIEVFLVFTDINSMIHVYRIVGNDFPYYYAPVGLKCNVVAFAVKNGKVYSSFTPITITNNMTVDFPLTETTITQFKAKLETLN